jgi:RNA polymerase sigma-70 factor (ECF subfamily)
MSGPSNIVQHIRSVLEAPGDSGRNDAQLLDDFAGRRDQTAFATLVRRHGRLVLAVCRRVLGNAHEAEDAFQATFLVLARRAGALRLRHSLSSWLYGVAYRLALKTRTRASRQRQHEARAAAAHMSPAHDNLSWNEVRAVLDEELTRLPERLRAPLILCYLTGKTQDEAAQHIGWSLATFRRRLERGRILLRDRLTRRGLALSAALSALLAQDALAAVPVPLLTGTVETATAFAAGQGPVTSPSVILAEELMKAMSATRLKLAAAVVLTLGLLALGTGFALHRALAGANKPAPAVAGADDKPPADPPMPRQLLAVCPSGYLFANPIYHGGTDATAVPRLVRQLGQLLGVPDDQSALLSDRAPVPFTPTRANIKTTVADFLDSGQEQHRLVLLFAGHAVELGNQAYLVPLDGELDKEQTLVSLEWLYDRLAKCKARQKVLILDVCRFNPQRGVERGTLDKMGGNLDKMLRQPPRGVEVLTACTAGEFSYESDSDGGLFLEQLSKLREAGGLKDLQDAADKPLPLQPLSWQVAKPLQAAAKQLFKADQTVRLAGAEANPGLAYDPKQARPSRPALAVAAPDPAAAPRGHVLRIFKLAERVPPLLTSQRVQPLPFEVLPAYPKDKVALYPDDADNDLRGALQSGIDLLIKHAPAFQDTTPPPPPPPPPPANGQLRNQFFQEMTRRQMGLALVYNDLESKYEEMKLLTDDFKTAGPQWRAPYLYGQAMLLYRMACFYEYNAMLGKVRKEELPPFDPQQHKGYRLVPKANMSDRDAQKIAQQAKKLLKQLADDHKGTPWELIAKRELLTNLGLEWQPY